MNPMQAAFARISRAFLALAVLGLVSCESSGKTAVADTGKPSPAQTAAAGETPARKAASDAGSSESTGYPAGYFPARRSASVSRCFDRAIVDENIRRRP
jgi:hypothetical protein